MHVVLHGEAGDLFWRGKHRAQVNVEAKIGIGAGDHFGPAIVTVLTHFGDQNARAAAAFREEFFGLRNNSVELAGGFV